MPSRNSFEDSMAQLRMAFRVEMKFGVIQTRVCLIQYVCAVCVVRTIPFILFPEHALSLEHEKNVKFVGPSFRVASQRVVMVMSI